MTGAPVAWAALLPGAASAGGLAPGVLGVTFVIVTTLAIGSYGLRVSRTTSDFMVASRTVGPAWNASAISGEYLSAASFLGIAGLILVFGADMLWYPVGWTAGYLVLLVLVAAPLRRSGAYTLSDFAEARLESRTVRLCCTVLVVALGWLYLLPQFRGAGLTLNATLGAPEWVGTAVVAAVVLLNVAGGGMRAVTFVQAFQYWLKLTALLVPLCVLMVVWLGDGAPHPADVLPLPAAVDEGPSEALGASDWTSPVSGGGLQGLYATYSVVLATFLGTMGLPHVVIRFYTNPDGRAARRTTVVVLALLGAFYLLPPLYGALGRVYAPHLAVEGEADSLVLALPRLMLDGWGGEALTGLVIAGAFAAFLSTASGLTIAIAGVLGQDFTSRPVRGRSLSGVAAFRVGAVVAVLAPALLALLALDLGIARIVGLAFAMAASTFCPLLVLGIWWRGLTAAGAMAGLVVGGLTAGGAATWTMFAPVDEGWGSVLLGQPAAWTVPLAFATFIVVSLATKDRTPSGAQRFMVRLHTPESVPLERGTLERGTLERGTGDD